MKRRGGKLKCPRSYKWRVFSTRSHQTVSCHRTKRAAKRAKKSGTYVIHDK